MDMRVANAYNVYGVYNAKSSTGVKKPEALAKGEGVKDTFTLSMQAEDYQTVRKALADIPDIRSEKVAQLKAQMDNNSYQVSSADVAARILKGTDE